MHLIIRQFFYGYFRFFHLVSVMGIQHIPRRGGAILISNHPSYFDPILVHLGTRRLVHFLAWDALFNIPLIGTGLHKLGSIPVNTSHSPNPGAFRKALRVLRDGKLLGIFPEGGRTPLDLDMVVSEFRLGAFKMAYLTGVPLIPIAITGAQKVWPRIHKFPKLSGKISVQFFPAISVEKRPSKQVSSQDLEELRHRVMTPILSTLRSVEGEIILENHRHTFPGWYKSPEDSGRQKEPL